MNTINSPTATNLARGTIIELAQNVYNNALAAQEQANRAQGIVDGAIDRATAEADRAGVARIAAEAAASAADGAATAADGSWNAATEEADRAESERIAAEQAKKLAEAAADSASGYAANAEDAAARAEAAAGGGGGGGGVLLNAIEYTDGWYIDVPVERTWHENGVIVVSGNKTDGTPIVGVVPVWALYSGVYDFRSFTPWLGDYDGVFADATSLNILGVAEAKFILYGG